MCSTLPCILWELCWQSSRGNNIFIGLHPIVGINHWKLSRSLLASLHDRNLIVLKKDFVDCDDPSLGRLSTATLGLAGVVALEWEEFISSLWEAGIIFSEASDTLVCIGNKQMGTVMTSLAYSSLFKKYRVLQLDWWHTKLWKMKVPSKAKCFAWLVLSHKILT